MSNELQLGYFGIAAWFVFVEENILIEKFSHSYARLIEEVTHRVAHLRSELVKKRGEVKHGNKI